MNAPTPGGGAPRFVTKPAITDRRIRFALVGCGRISANHFDALERHAARAEVVAVCDVDPAALAAAVERTGAPGFASLEAADACRSRTRRHGRPYPALMENRGAA